MTAPLQREVFSPSEPRPNARLFRDTEHERDGVPLLAWQAGDWRRWNGAAYDVVEEVQLDKWLYDFFGDAHYVKETKEDARKVRFSPNEHKLRQLKHALRALCMEQRTIDPPTWLDGRDTPSAVDVIPMANGLLHWPTRTLHPHDPHFWTFHHVPFDYDPDAGPATAWTTFLDSVWPDDQQAIDCLQEVIGYLLSGDTRLQKIFGIFGPPRSGKGTIARVIKALLGEHNVSGITTQGLGSQFGLQGLIGRPVAILADARLRASQDAVVERMLAISGEDTLQIDRKYGEPWNGRLGTRFLLMSNELPNLADASGALASRFVVLTMERSFLGNEDPQLEAKLLPEVPAILNWALDGLARLQDRGHFVPPDSSSEMVQELHDLGAPVQAFVRDRCIVEPGRQVDTDQLYRAWRVWCDDNGRDHKGTAQTFGRNLRAAVPGLRLSKRRTTTGGRQNAYDGIGLDGGVL